MLEKRAAAGMRVHTESGNLYRVLLHPTENCQPYNKVAVACLVVFVGGSSIIHRIGSQETHGSQFSTLGYYKQMLWSNFYIQFLIKVITFAILESMTNYIPSREAIIQEGSLVSCSVYMLKHDVGERQFLVSDILHGFQDVICHSTFHGKSLKTSILKLNDAGVWKRLSRNPWEVPGFWFYVISADSKQSS